MLARPAFAAASEALWDSSARRTSRRSSRERGSRRIALRKKSPGESPALDALLLADSQTASVTDVDYYWRDIVQPLVGRHGASLGLTLGDIVNDDLSLYPQILRTTMRLRFAATPRP